MSEPTFRRRRPPPAAQPQPPTVNVELPADGVLISLEVDSSDTIENIKQKVQERSHKARGGATSRAEVLPSSPSPHRPCTPPSRPPAPTCRRTKRASPLIGRPSRTTAHRCRTGGPCSTTASNMAQRSCSNSSAAASPAWSAPSASAPTTPATERARPPAAPPPWLSLPLPSRPLPSPIPAPTQHPCRFFLCHPSAQFSPCVHPRAGPSPRALSTLHGRQPTTFETRQDVLSFHEALCSYSSCCNQLFSSRCRDSRVS